MSYLQPEVTTLALCWRIIRKDGINLAFTCCDHDLLIKGEVFHSSASFTQSAIISTDSLSVDNLEMQGVLTSDLLKADDIYAGLYDYAQVAVFLVDYNDPENNQLNLRTGWLGEVQHDGKQFVTEVRGLLQAFSKNLGNLYSPLCRARFCDAKCGLDEKKYTFAGEVERVLGRKSFIAYKFTHPNNFFSFGKIVFQSGLNQGLLCEISNQTGNRIDLAMPATFALEVGDRFAITAGCDKKIETCGKRFANVINFRGEPRIPIPERLVK
jgi:uncharacterized phage protein (TIGR02218 family)